MNSETILTVGDWRLCEERLYDGCLGLIARHGEEGEFLCYWPLRSGIPLKFIRPTKEFAEAVTAWMRLIT